MTITTRAAWVGAGACFALYPALRPYADETTMAGLQAMASGRWIVAHLLGMAAFVLLAVAVAGTLGPRTRAVAMISAALLLPYYGGEAFALHAIGQEAVRTGDVGLLQVVDGFRYQPVAITMFGLGLLLLALLGVLVTVGLWQRQGWTRWSALVVGLGLIAYLPQFFGTRELRIVHGVVLGVACMVLGLATAGPGAQKPAAEDPFDRRIKSGTH